MFKIKNTILSATIIALFAMSGNSAMAAEQKTSAQLIVEIMEEIKRLQLLIKDRVDFKQNKFDLIKDEERTEDFFLRLAEDSATKVYGNTESNIKLETDGGVRQILITNSCADSAVILLDNTKCATNTWVVDANLNSGIKTFTVPAKLVTNKDEDIMQLSVIACRFDGCVMETEIELPYKSEIDFSDQVSIYDRYEWTYEWNDRKYHVQEVLLNFPYKDIKEVELRVRCEEGQLYIATNEDDRATCNNRRRYSNIDYRDFETDDQGNEYNLRIESVTEYLPDYPVGLVDMEFKFIHKRNHVVALINHYPVQLDDLAEEDEEPEDEEAEK